jgi:acyl-coenzyme A thioesterase PaaI-like protein
MKSLQEELAPNSICFGCGPANSQGLRIQSFAAGDSLVCDWKPEPHHQAFPGVLNGGIIGALLDCHSNWTAVHHLMQRDHLEAAPSCVTAEFSVKLKRPTPTDAPVHLSAHVVQSEGDKVTVEAELEAGGKITATCRGIFVRVQPGHPGYHRW